MKKILGISSYPFLPAVSGGQKAIAALYSTLAVSFKLTCIGTGNIVNNGSGYAIKNFFTKSPLRYGNVLNVLPLRKIIVDQQIDYVQIEHPYLGWLAVLLKKTTNAKLIVRSHNIEGLRFKHLNKWWWKLLLSYEGWVYRNADVVLFITDQDKVYAEEHLKVNSHKAFTITFGVDKNQKPLSAERHAAKLFLKHKYNLPPEVVIILFNGAFDYAPNCNALYHLVNDIFPLLNKMVNTNFKLIICGKSIPEQIANADMPNIIVAGFVDSIDPYLLGANIFANSITEGGGIKTKLVEALAFNLTSVSYESGAIGIDQKYTSKKMLVVKDGDAMAFAQAIFETSNLQFDIPDDFYQHFSKKAILEKLKNIL